MNDELEDLAKAIEDRRLVPSEDSIVWLNTVLALLQNDHDKVVEMADKVLAAYKERFDVKG
jgi:hypothetical protein